MFEPAYIGTVKEGVLESKIRSAREMLKSCRVCPRECHVNRLEAELGFCEVGPRSVVSSANPHFGEESPLVGSNGSGTIFMTSCNLKCIFCQNYDISHEMDGDELEPPQMARLMLELQGTGCHNINIVTPTPHVPALLEAIGIAAGAGLKIPIVYNTGGYDSVETLKLLEGVVDIYMPDLKFMDSKVSDTLMTAPDYPDVVRDAIREMHRQVGDLVIDESGLATRGLLIRHLVMPNGMADTRAAMRFLAQEISMNTYVNIMDQYRPCGRANQHPDTNRSITRTEYLQALEMAKEEGIDRLDERIGLRLRSF